MADGLEAVARVANHWDGRAAAYNDHYLTRRTQQDRLEWLSAYRQALTSLLPRRGAPLRILDVGTGTGFVSTLLAELGHDVTGIDLSPAMLDYARNDAQRRSVGLRLQRRGAHDVASLGTAFDVVTCRYVLWTLPDPALALSRWRTVLEPGGALLVADAVWHTWRQEWQRLCAAPWSKTDRAYVRRFPRAYATLRRLPYYRGLSAEDARELVLAAGFSDPQRFDQVLPARAHPSRANLFFLGARNPATVKGTGHV